MDRKFSFQRRPSVLAAVVSVLIALAVVSGTQPAAAQETGTIRLIDGGGEVSAVAVSEGESISSSPGPGSQQPTEYPWTCFFRGSVTEVLEGRSTTNPIPGQIYALFCDPNPGFEARGAIFDPSYLYDPAVITGTPPFVTSAAVREAAQNIAIPPPLPPRLSPEARQITGIETWFWPDGSLDPVLASATAGGLTVTVEARYQETEFQVGAPNEATFTCSTFVEWAPGIDSSPCTYSFINESASQSVIAESTWDFYWWDNAGQPTPVLYGTLTNTEEVDVEVIDLEAVISRR